MPDVDPILLAEDDQNDAFFIQNAFARAGVPNPLKVVRHGGEAIEYLSGTGQYGDRSHYPLPCCMITDIKMPKVDGFELLAWVRNQPQLKELPVIVFSSSSDESDQKRMFELGARAYFRKPGDFSELVALVKNWKWTHFEKYCREKSF